MVVFKLKNNMKLSKKEEKALAKKTSTHIWSQFLNWYECTNAHCWLTYKTGSYEKCGYRTKDCNCTSKLKNIKCEMCDKPGVDYKYDLPEERDLSAELTNALRKYKELKIYNNNLIVSFSQ